MVKLTPDLIQQSMQYTNPVRDRELDLRGYKIPVIENMGATLGCVKDFIFLLPVPQDLPELRRRIIAAISQINRDMLQRIRAVMDYRLDDQFDTVDFSDNDIRKLDGFPLLKRLKTLLLNNNRIVRIAEGLDSSLPNLETLVLTGNLIQELADLDPLASIKSLRTLSLLHNPVTTRQHYRLYVAFKLPQLRLLDFRKIKVKEREDASALFKSKKGKELQKEIAKKAKTFVPGAGLPDTSKPSGPSQEELWKIREAINKASSLEEVERLNRLLQSGQIPGRGKLSSKAPSLVEEDDDEAMDTSGPGINGK